MFESRFVGFDFALFNNREQCTLRHARVVLGNVFVTAFVNFTQHAVLELTAATRACRTIFAVFAGVVSILTDVANALTADTFTVTAAYFIIIWGGAVGDVLKALAGGARVVGQAAALATYTLAVARTQLSLIPVAGEIIAFAERSGYYLERIVHLIALANAADASPAVGAERAGRRVSGPAAALLLDRDAAVRGTLAALAEAAGVAEADAARHHTLAATH